MIKPTMVIRLLSAIMILAGRVAAFSPPKPVGVDTVRLETTKAFSSLKDPPQKEEAISTVVNVDVSAPPPQEEKSDGLPWWWELVWKLDIMKKGEPGKDIIFGDSANVLRTNIEQIYGGYPSLDGCPLAEGTSLNQSCSPAEWAIVSEPFAPTFFFQPLATRRNY